MASILDLIWSFRQKRVLLFVIHFIGCFDKAFASTWSEWWTYDGISGPGFWGLVNAEWSLCSKGKKQSPINIIPSDLLYDPSLRHLHVDKHRVAGSLANTGQDIKLTLDDSNAHYINISGGPMQYQYRITELILHFGSINSLGSEHAINGQSFPAEIQILGWNSDLYGNLTQAIYSSNGLAMIGILVQVGKKPNKEFEGIAQKLNEIRYKGQQVRIRHLSISNLIPSTKEYMTYEGSLTQPGCHETVTWMIINKPMYISNEHLMMLRNIMKGEESHPIAAMENNGRPTKPLNHRPVRTNINFPQPSKGCSMEKILHYQANVWEKEDHPIPGES